MLANILFKMCLHMKMSFTTRREKKRRKRGKR
jgi:hypothetical protein